MARSMMSDVTTDLQDDSGSILWSIVQGEQLEYPVTLKFIENVSGGYTYEAVVVEGLNVADSLVPPEVIKPGGIQTKLVVRTPTYRGEWLEGALYQINDVVKYSDKYYINHYTSNYSSSVPPPQDSVWAEYVNNVIFIRFPKTMSLSPAWAIQPKANSKVYGFFELRVTEPATFAYPQTWKPMRGLVELQYSPTETVPDT